MTIPPTTPIPDIDPLFRDRVNVIYGEWQNGVLAYSDALKRLEELRGEAGSSINEAGIDNILGIINGYRSNYEESVRYFERARELYEKAGAIMRVASCDLNLGETYRLRGNFNRARTYFHSAYEAGKALGVLRIQVLALTNEGQLWMSLNSREKAKTTLLQGLELSATPWSDPENERDRVDRADNVCELHHALVSIRLLDNDPDGAWQDATLAMQNARITGRPIRLGFANRAIADVLTDLEQAPDPAYQSDPDFYYEEALKAFRQVKAEGEVGKTLFAQGKSSLKRGKKRSAGRFLQQAMVIFTKLGMTDDAAKAAQEQMNTI